MPINPVQGNLRDCVIVGGGPAGLSAGIYLARVGLNPLLVERDSLGGHARLIEKVENYPGFLNGISGAALMKRFAAQAGRWKLRTLKAEVVKAERRRGHFLFETTAGTLRAKAAIFSTGAAFKRLGVPGEEKFSGRGVYHAAFKHAKEFEGKTVAVAGGGDAAVLEALLLARSAAKVYLIHRGSNWAAHGLLQKKLKTAKKIHPIFNTVIRRVLGDQTLKSIEIESVGNGGRTGPRRSFLDVDGLIVLIGKKPDFGLVQEVNKHPGVFLAGDVRLGRFRQVAIAAGDGVRAAMQCADYLNQKKEVQRSPRAELALLNYAKVIEQLRPRRHCEAPRGPRQSHREQSPS
ncbi:MAG: FAD-dependent oxidoreductase [Elusimicrobia bacterium]|nr:FAD-dependent oxidoreductase [Elusimicrobiota bacterium]